jgi:cobyric acid synthase
MRKISNLLKPVFLLADLDSINNISNNQPVLNSVITSLKTANPKAVCISLFTYNITAIQKSVSACMETYGAAYTAHLNENSHMDEFKNIERADVIVLISGKPDLAQKHIQKTGIEGCILNGYHKGAVIFGVSGGAVQLGKLGWTIDKDNNYLFFEGLNIIPYAINIKDENHEWRALKDIIVNHYHDIHGLGIPGHGGIVHYPDRSIQALNQTSVEFQFVDGKLWQNNIYPAGIDD